MANSSIYFLVRSKFYFVVWVHSFAKHKAKIICGIVVFEKVIDLLRRII
jgi:hypothetical protein